MNILQSYKIIIDIDHKFNTFDKILTTFQKSLLSDLSSVGNLIIACMNLCLISSEIYCTK